MDLIETPRIRIYGSGPISVVQITPSDRSAYGMYKCIATNILGEAEHIIDFREAYPPGTIVQVSVFVCCNQRALEAITITSTN